MSDIFISYKREERAAARKLADALEGEGWTVWWDPKLRAGERFNDVIEKALNESKCVVVIWSKRSVKSQYVKDEATYALNRNKLVPVMIEEVELPFRFEGLHTPSLLGWDGSKDSTEFRKLIDDILANTDFAEQRHNVLRPHETSDKLTSPSAGPTSGYTDDQKYAKASELYENGTALWKNDRYVEPDKALQYYDKAVSLWPWHNLARAERARIYAQLGNLDQALTEIDSVINSGIDRPMPGSHYSVRGAVYWQMGEATKACEDWKKAAQAVTRPSKEAAANLRNTVSPGEKQILVCHS